MTVNRVSNIKVNDNNSLFTAVYGNVANGEFFIDSDLRKYSFEEQLYLYLKSEGYTVLFYKASNTYNVYSYSEEDVRTFIFDFPQEQQDKEKKYVSQHMKTPFGLSQKNKITDNAKQANTEASEEQKRNAYFEDSPLNKETNKSHNYWVVKRNIYLLDDLKRLISHQDPNKKVAFIIAEAESCNFHDPIIDDWISIYHSFSAKHKFFLIYKYEDAQSLAQSLNGGTYERLFFKQENDDEQKNRKLIEKTTYRVPLPDKEEITNLVNLRRLKEKFDAFSQISFDKLALRILQKRELLKDLYSCDINKEIEKAQEKTAKERLKSLRGIDAVFEQLEKRVKSMKKNRKSNTPTTFRPHLVFKGNPGTGKTTVACLFAEWLQEEDILPIGHLIEAKSGDLIGNAIGYTRIKTQQVCDKAKEGVLFIDEAYGLFDAREEEIGGNGNIFGKEAIDTLIQFMENNKDDSVVILAGYTEKIDELLNKGNDGFSSRIGAHIVFDDYSPDVLWKIAKDKLISYQLTNEAETIVQKYLRKKHKKRHRNWGNARVAEQIVQDILIEFDNTEDDSIDVKHIPADCQRIANPITDLSHSNGYKQLIDKFVGLSFMKNEINAIFNTIKANLIREQKNLTTVELIDKFNFVFTGNPGTGKTEVARLLGEILFDLGILIEGKDVIEISAKDVVSSGDGETAKNITRKFEDALGKILFLDEVYSIKDENAINTIVQLLTSPDYMGKMVVVIAGYPKPVRQWLEINEGLPSRFNKPIPFDDYTNDELYQILESHINEKNCKILPKCKSRAIKWFNSKRNDKKFANARTAKSLFDDILFPSLNNRIVDNPNLDTDSLFTITEQDFPTSGVTESGKGIQKLNKLIGLTQMKQTLETILTSIKADKIRNEKLNIDSSKNVLNFVFRGNPGTGKTTVARIMGEILFEYGLLNSPDVVECSRSQIIAKYAGQTAPRVRALFESAKGKVLFFDEIYSLVNGTHDEFGKEAINEIVALMTSPEFQGQMAFVIAGYPKQTDNFIAQNPGLNRRFNYYIDFEDYSDEELWDIYQLKVADIKFRVEENCKTTAINWFKLRPRSADFKNAGYADELLGITKSNLDKRIAKLDLDNTESSILNTIILQDFPS
ncbi:hypothetical protein FACS1894201_02980 [Bacteroidia bacterium]|nr:hypothetical protein FACS1894201_02980 [Bacteroidia bacterium]